MNDYPIHPSLRNARPSPTLAMNEMAREMERMGKTIYKFGFGQSPFAVPDLVVRALRDSAHEKDYLPVTGLPALREAVAEYHRAQNIECSAGEILIGPGSKQLMYLLFLVLEADLWIPAPSWVSYAPQAAMLGRPTHWISTTFESGWRLTASQMSTIPDGGGIVILNYPNNPTGLTYPVDELRELADIARSKKLLLLSDEIYGELQHDGQHRSIAEFYPEGTFVASGLSKWCGAGGWRIGTLRVPASSPEVKAALSIAASETYSCAAAPTQYAAVAAYTDRTEIPAYLASCRAQLRSLGGECAAILREAGVGLHDPQCGFYLFPDFRGMQDRLAARGIQTSDELCLRLLEETGVALLAATSFGQSASALQARLAYVDLERSVEGVRKLAAWLRNA
jgi:aspartate aminotransferase